MNAGRGFEPAGDRPDELPPRLRTLYRSIDQAQRQRPSVRAERLGLRHLDRVRSLERQGTYRGSGGGVPFSRCSEAGWTPDPGDSRTTVHGNMRRRPATRVLELTIRARDAGVRLRNAYATTSTPRLRALLTRRRRSFDIAGGAHL